MANIFQAWSLKRDGASRPDRTHFGCWHGTGLRNENAKNYLVVWSWQCTALLLVDTKQEDRYIWILWRCYSASGYSTATNAQYWSPETASCMRFVNFLGIQTSISEQTQSNLKILFLGTWLCLWARQGIQIYRSSWLVSTNRSAVHCQLQTTK